MEEDYLKYVFEKGVFEEKIYIKGCATNILLVETDHAFYVSFSYQVYFLRIFIKKTVDEKNYVIWYIYVIYFFQDYRLNANT